MAKRRKQDKVFETAVSHIKANTHDFDVKWKDGIPERDSPEYGEYMADSVAIQNSNNAILAQYAELAPVAVPVDAGRADQLDAIVVMWIIWIAALVFFVINAPVVNQ